MSKLGALVFIIGACLGVFFFTLLVKPDTFRRLTTSFPRHKLIGWFLLAVDIWWSALLLLKMEMGGLDKYKPLVYPLAPVLFILAAVFVDDLLAARSLGGLLALFPALILDLARFQVFPMRLLVVSVCYLFVIVGISLMLSPYRMRHACVYFSKDRRKSIVIGLLGVIVSLLLIISALTLS